MSIEYFNFRDRLLNHMDSSAIREELGRDIAKISDLFVTKDLKDLLIEYMKYPESTEVISRNFEMIKNGFFVDKLDDEVGTEDFFEFVRALKGREGLEREYEEYSYWANLYDQIKVPEYDPRKMNINMWRLSSSERLKVLGDIGAKAQKKTEFAKLVCSDDREEKRIVLEKIANGNEYEYVSNGTTSFVIKAGDQVVKLGAGKRKYEIPYHPRIMMPYFRKKYSDDSVIEIFNYGNCESVDITDEKLLQIYQELEDAGIVWTDARKSNLLVLKSDNLLPDFIKSEDFNVFGFLQDERFPTTNHIALKKGDLVICDLDMLFAKDDPMAKQEIGVLDEVIENYLKQKRAKPDDIEL